MIRIQQKFEVTITADDILHICNKTVEEFLKVFEDKPIEKDVHEILVNEYGSGEGVTIEVRPLTDVSVTDIPTEDEPPAQEQPIQLQSDK